MAMPSRPGHLMGVVMAAIMMLTWVTAASRAAHPPLPRDGSASCQVCHDDKAPAGVNVHAPVADDCTMCHEVAVTPEATTVTLMAEEPDLCLACHDDKQAAADLELTAPHPAMAMDCTGCHDPHSSIQPALLAMPAVELCQSCHDIADLGEAHSGQITGKVNCLNCHAPHGSDQPNMLAAKGLHAPFSSGSCIACHRPVAGERIRLRARGESLCTSCHGDVSDASGGSTHAALHGERGRAGCLNCHDPHMAAEPKLLLHASGDLCGTCHAPIAAAAAAETGHPPAADDCMTCHLPHTSEEDQLLVAPRGDLCVMCHDTEDAELMGRHLGADLTTLDCTSCHDPHGTGHPSLLARVLHAPVTMGCDTCHEGTSEQFVTEDKNELCLMCHDDIGELAATSPVQHAAMEVAECVDCHDPHASNQNSLVKQAGGGVCFTCHDDKAPDKHETGHGIIDLAGCQSCHEPHGGSREKLLAAAEPDLCLDCHDLRKLPAQEPDGTIKLRGRFSVPKAVAQAAASLLLSSDEQHDHPIQGHRVLGDPTPEELKKTETLFRDTFTCRTCHDPHKGRTGLLAGKVATRSEACAQCHMN